MKKITLEDVLKKTKKLSRGDINLIKKAYEYAKKKHKGQKRKTGGPYIIHPLYTAFYVADLGLGRDTICAAFLHDVIEDCNVKEKELEKEFNPVIARLVKGVTDLRHTSDRKITKSSVENLRRFFIVAAKDIRAVIIKLADRLHNALTIQGLTPRRQKSYAQEIKYVYSALSEYLGIAYFKRQFDDISFKILNPAEYKKIENYLNRHHRKRTRYVKRIIKKLEKILKENRVKANIYGREKSINSIFKKLQKYMREGRIHSKSEYGRIYDNYGFRILVRSKEECYKVLGIIHSTWHPLNGEFDDFIANPKPNGYRSLQTTVFCDNDKLAEIQIRTHKMHEYNEFGPASHIAYKLSGTRAPLPTTAFEWLRKINIFNRGEEAEKKKENIFKIDVFKDNIFVLTPQNEVKKLPKGATAIDFAYTVHTEVGNKCRGAKVNGKMVSLDYELHTGDQIEIIVDKHAKYPIPKWLEFVVSSGARSKIKQVLRDKEEKEATEKGLAKLNKALKRYNTTFKQLCKNRPNDIDIITYKNNAKDRNGLLAGIGFDLVNTDKVISYLFPKSKKKRKLSRTTKTISIEGSTQTAHTRAKCCKPRVGDEIVALNTAIRGIRIHKANCPYVKNFKKDRLLKAKWV